jgi:long-chain fatty acid transport protein
MKRFLKLAVILGLMIGLTPGLYSNGLNLNSNGTKAIAMGGAFIGLADDYSAVFWNPAGLTQMKETTLALFGTDIIPDAEYKFRFDPYAINIDAQAESKHYPSGGLGFFKPLSEKVVVGIYAYVPSGLGVTWDGNDLLAYSGGVPMEWETFVGVITVSPAVAVKLTDQLSLGATINFNYGMAHIKKPVPIVGQYEDDLSGTAIGATIGMLFKPSEKFSIGVTYKTPLKATLSGDATIQGAAMLNLPTTDTAEREITWPMWLGGGIAVKPIDKLTITADVQYTNWKKMDILPMTYSDPGWKFAFEAGSYIELYWEDKVQLRFGMEYKLSDKLALRGGYYYDPSPSPTETQNILLPELTYNWITFGLGYKTDKMSLELGFEYGMGQEVEVDPAPDFSMPPFPGTHNMTIMVPNIAFTYRF